MGKTRNYRKWEAFYNNRKEKKCVVCDTNFLPFSGVHKFCSPKCKGKWKYITGSGSTENQYKKISGNWHKYFLRLLQQHKRKEDGLTVEDLLKKLEQQEGLCAISGVKLTCILQNGVITKTNASIDRIEAGGPYVASNIQLVCRSLNSWRSDTDLSEFIWWCKQVTKWQDGKE
jgi:hypothetical protein